MKKVLALIAIILLGSQFAPEIGQAENSMAYSIKADIPENQIDKTLTYFDLKMEPSQNQTITLTVSNSSDKEATIVISPNVALTNQNGVIDYSKSDVKKDSSMKYSIDSILSKKQEVLLKAGETKKVPFTLQMPDEAFDGLILGGFYVSKKEDSSKEKETEKNVQIKNKYSYVIGIKIRSTMNEVQPKMELNQIKPALLNYRTAVTANLQNTEATIIPDLDVEAKVMKKGRKEILHETTKKGMSMAPNSNFDFPISWDNQSLEPGNYMLKVVAKSGENQWKFEKEFKIASKDSADLNKEAIEIEKTAPNWTFIILGTLLGMLLMILLIVYFIYRHKKKKEAEKRARLARQRKRKKLANARQKKVQSANNINKKSQNDRQRQSQKKQNKKEY